MLIHNLLGTSKMANNHRHLKGVNRQTFRQLNQSYTTHIQKISDQLPLLDLWGVCDESIE